MDLLVTSLQAVPDVNQTSAREVIKKALSNVTLHDLKLQKKYAFNEECSSLLLQKPRYSVLLVLWKSNEVVLHNHPSSAIIKVMQGNLRASSSRDGKFASKDVTLLHDGDIWELNLKDADGYKLEQESPDFDDNLITISLHIHLYPGPGIMSPCCVNCRPWVLCNDLKESICERHRMSCVASYTKLLATEADENRKNINPGICYTNFRDLIKMLHDRIEPLPPGQFHSESHIAEICGFLESVRLNNKEFGRYLRFRDDHYTRNLVGYDVPDGNGNQAKFTVLLLCWDKGQMSPIHDHAGSSCWVKVLVGQLREIRYVEDETGMPSEVDSGGNNIAKAKLKKVRDITAGLDEVCYINDTQGIHAMGNPNSDQVCVSLHVYAPPYVLCKLFDEKTGDVSVGSMAVATTPCNPFAPIPNTGQFHSPLDQFKERLNICGFMNCLRDLENESKNDDDDELAGSWNAPGELLSRLYLKEREWKEFVHFDQYRYQRSLVAYNANFSLVLNCWNKGQTTPIHDHGSKPRGTWVKVLRGNLVLRKYSGDKGSPIFGSEYKFKEGEMVQKENESLFDGLHLLGNEEDTPAVSLHLYSPPIMDLKYQDNCGNRLEIPLVHSATSLMNHINNQHLDQISNDIRKVRFEAEGKKLNEERKRASEDSDYQNGESEEELDNAADAIQYSSIHNFCRYIRKHVFQKPGELTNTERFRIVSKLFSKFEFQEEEWMPYYTSVKSLRLEKRERSWSGSERFSLSRDTSSRSIGSIGSSASGLCEDEHELFVSALLAKADNFSLRLVCWEPGFVQTPQLQQNANCCWIKVLDGNIDETLYHTNPFASGNRLEVVHNVTLGDHGSVTFIGPTLVFALENNYKKPCYALHLEFHSS